MDKYCYEEELELEREMKKTHGKPKINFIDYFIFIAIIFLSIISLVLEW